MFAKSGVVSLGGQLVVEFINETLCRRRGNGGNFSCVLGKDMVVADANRSIMLIISKITKAIGEVDEY